MVNSCVDDCREDSLTIIRPCLNEERGNDVSISSFINSLSIYLYLDMHYIIEKPSIYIIPERYTVSLEKISHSCRNRLFKIDVPFVICTLLQQLQPYFIISDTRSDGDTEMIVHEVIALVVD